MVKRLEGLLVFPLVVSAIPLGIGLYKSMGTEEISIRLADIAGGIIVGAGLLGVSLGLRNYAREIKEKFYPPKL